MQIMRLIPAFNCCLSPAIQDQLRTKIKSRVAECNCTLQAKQSSEIAMFQLLNHTKKMNSIKLTFGVKKQIAIAKPRKKQGYEALGGSQDCGDRCDPDSSWLPTSTRWTSHTWEGMMRLLLICFQI